MATTLSNTPATMTAVSGSTTGVQEPFDLMRLSISERVYVKMRGDRELRGTLHAYDGHMNLIMSDVEETIYVLEDQQPQQTATNTNALTNGDQIKIIKKKSEMMFVRGDGVILVSPPSRT